jgi:hypothetical protein
MTIEKASENAGKPVKANKRSTDWTFIVYPDSAPVDWRDIIDSEHISWNESPLHDSD